MTGSSAVPPAAAASKRDWRDLRTRLVSASLLLPAGLFCIWFGGPFFALLLLLLLVAAGIEWAGLLRVKLRSLRGAALMGWPSLACLAALVTGQWRQALLVLLAPLVLGAPIVFGTVALGLGGLALLFLRVSPGVGGLGWLGLLHADWGLPQGDVRSQGWGAVLLLVVVVIGSDSGAYLVGRQLGGPKLAPSISPGKTRSGAVGGLVVAALAGGVLALVLPSPSWLGGAAAATSGAVTGLLLGLVAQCGDLAESAFKRRCGVKDSGKLIPGHGGVLDRFDGLLAAAPVAALLSLLSPAGVPFWLAGATVFAGGPAARAF